MITTSLLPQKRDILFNRAITEIYNPTEKSVKTGSAGFDKVLFNTDLTTLIHCPIPVSGSYSIPHSVITIGIESFAQCKGLTSIIIPASVEVIGCLAFHNCKGLTTISIPDSIINIGYRAFSNCTSIKSIYIHAQTPVVVMHDSDIFHNVDKTSCTLYVPVGSKDTYQQAELWKEFKNITEINFMD